ncbi:hypothetical protein Taro_000905, partial [Colocasia esculenta]|nr:hypothetical protein [Colocasia esculenta]
MRWGWHFHIHPHLHLPQASVRPIENRLAMMQMAMTTRVILQMIKSLVVGEQASSDVN